MSNFNSSPAAHSLRQADCGEPSSRFFIHPSLPPMPTRRIELSQERWEREAIASSSDRNIGVTVFLILFGLTPILFFYAVYRCLELWLG